MNSAVFQPHPGAFEQDLRMLEPLADLTRSDQGEYQDPQTALAWAAYRRFYAHFAERTVVKRPGVPKRPFIIGRSDPQRPGLYLRHYPRVHNTADLAIAEAQRLHTAHGPQFMVFAAIFSTPKPAAAPTLSLPSADGEPQN